MGSPKGYSFYLEGVELFYNTTKSGKRNCNTSGNKVENRIKLITTSLVNDRSSYRNV